MVAAAPLDLGIRHGLDNGLDDFPAGRPSGCRIRGLERDLTAYSNAIATSSEPLSSAGLAACDAKPADRSARCLASARGRCHRRRASRTRLADAHDRP